MKKENEKKKRRHEQNPSVRAFCRNPDEWWTHSDKTAVVASHMTESKQQAERLPNEDSERPVALHPPAPAAGEQTSPTR